MKKLIPLFVALLLPLITITGCHTPTKDERYNNLSADDIYHQAVKNLKKKNYDDAVDDFEALESRYPFGQYADKAQLGAIYAYYENEDYPTAIPAIERFLRMYPRHPNVDYAYYMKGLTHFSESLGFFGRYFPMEREDRDVTAARKSLQEFNTLTTMFPSSVYSPDAKLRMVYLRNMLAQNELVAARFYLKKGAYLAAATRANYVIANFDQTPSVPEGLAIMVEAYRKLELNHLADDAYRVLAYNYPTSEYTEDLG